MTRTKPCTSKTPTSKGWPGVGPRRACTTRHSAVLEAQASRRGRTFVKVDRFFPSTQMCSDCGVLSGPKGLEGLAVRTWACPCGSVHERDVNAEVNIRFEGKRLVRVQTVAAGHAETRNASGGQVRPGRPGAVRKPASGRNEEPIRTGDAIASP
ncbi:transposase [Glycomyces albidus]|uniref:transposase n=1 Tax=Glycomyces albidus TaxID=2656774 RepID=UPI001D159E98